jgi:triphosphoribosyl-dephospho-CoA synthetase
VCCGSKRLTEIACPSDCPYLTTAREHPSAATVRQHERDVSLLVQFMQDLNERQSQLFLLIATFVIRYHPPELQQLIDDDVTAAVEAMAATFETSSRGVIYEHRPSSLPAERLSSSLKPLLLEAAGRHAGSAFERDAAVVLRRVKEAGDKARTEHPGNRRAFIDLLTRMIRAPEPSAAGPAADPDPPRLIVP